MEPAAVALAGIDWSRPWLAPVRKRGEALAEQAATHGIAATLDAAGSDLHLSAGRLRFVSQARLPAGEAYEAFIARTACVPTRENLHDFFNGLMWHSFPVLKRRLNALQAEQLACRGAAGPRGAVRDALTLFDENAALLQAPFVLVEALRRRDWQSLFVTGRADWARARLQLFGHALLEKLAQPRKAICAHVWVIPEHVDAQQFLVDRLTPEWLAGNPHLPMPVLGVPGWWPANHAASFYDDPAVFRTGQPDPESRARTKKKQRPSGRCFESVVARASGAATTG